MSDDAIVELSRLLAECGARVTFDGQRSTALPCVICGVTDQPRRLITIGTYTRRMGGGILPGDAIDRPMCDRCFALTEEP